MGCRRLLHLLAATALLLSLSAFVHSPLRLLPRPLYATTTAPSIWQYNLGDEQFNLRLLCRMIVQSHANASHEFAYSHFQIEEVVQQRKIKVHQVNRDSGLYPLRYSIRFGRRDVMRVLLKHGASAMSEDSEGTVREIVNTRPRRELDL